MEVTIILPAPLRKYAGNQKKVFTNASSVNEAFDELKVQSTNLIEHIIDSEQQVREFIKVFVNKKDITRLQGLETPLKQGDVVSIVPAFAGG
ncbi:MULTISPECIES: MoaD/ThiS family protein [unclassified Pseudoalteromonas]|uniref:MoaD/ThiS family protein n=1 Tax=unclassified Pseudoalteromonas TaxID=194690 RepID=UPI003014CA50